MTSTHNKSLWFGSVAPLISALAKNVICEGGMENGWGTNVSVDFAERSGSLAMLRQDAKASYTDGEFLFDQYGMRRVTQTGPPKSSLHEAVRKSAPHSPPLTAARQAAGEIDDDTLSIASTHVSWMREDNQYAVPASSIDRGARPKKSDSAHSHLARSDVDDWMKRSSPTCISQTSERRQGSVTSVRRESRPTEAMREKARVGNLLAQYDMDNILPMLVKVKKLGKGNSGVVWEAVLNDGKRRVPLALKEVPMPDDEEQREMTVREMKTLYHVTHPCIVTCHGAYFHNGSFLMVMDLMGAGSLLDLMKGAEELIPHDAIAFVTHNLLKALAYLHDEFNVVHRDVKPGNILLSLDGDVKLADLGICTQPGEDQTDKWIGTVTYMSPERIVGHTYSYPADVWSLGLVVLEAAMGMYPYMHTSLLGGSPAGGESPRGHTLEFWDLMDIVTKGPSAGEILAGAGVGASEEFVEMVNRCMCREDALRPTAAQCLGLRFVARGDMATKKHVLSQWVRRPHAMLEGSAGERKVCAATGCVPSGGAAAKASPVVEEKASLNWVEIFNDTFRSTWMTS